MREYPLFLLFSLIAAIFVAGRLWQSSFELHLARSELQFLKNEMGMVVDRRSSLPTLEGSAVSEDSTPLVTSGGGGIDNTPALHGHVDGIEHGQISGWACEEQSNSPPVDVIIYIDDHFLASVESKQPRGNGFLQQTCQVTPSAAGTVNAGFTFSLPPLPPGRHVARLFARDAARRVKMELSNSPIKFQEKLQTLNMLDELKSKDQVIKEKEARIATLTAQLDAREPVQSKMIEAHHSSMLARLIGRRALPPSSMQHSALTSANKRNPSVLSRGGTGRLLAFVGINTGFDSRPRRDLLRKTWMPHREHFDLLEQKLGIAIRFMIGHYRNTNEGFDEKDWEIEREMEEFGDIIRMDHQEDYNQLSTKTKFFFAQFSVQFDAEFYVKVDDDVYVNLDALAAQLNTLRGKSNVYMGCMKSGQVINDRRYKWFEPEWWRLGDSGNKYFRHATGQIYVLSHSLATYISMHADILHKFANEDTSVGAWMLALDVDFIDERRMCCQECRQQSQYNMCIAVWQWKCNGVCSAETTMPALDAQCASADSWRTFLPRTTKH